MQPIATTLDHVLLPPEIPAGDTHPAVILLHGRGANEGDLVGLTRGFDKRLLILSVRAPFPFSYDGGYTWYDIGALGAPEPKMFRESSERLDQFIRDAQQQYRINPKKLILLGFSMGTAMALTYALSHPDVPCGVIAHSGYIPEQTHLKYAWDRLSACKFLITHGVDDPVIPVFLARRVKELFRTSNASVTYREYEGGHEITPEMVADAERFLTDIVAVED
jgi:phospholipase/carboxylesterase